MKLYSEGYNYKLYHGNMLDMLQVIQPNSIDSIVTDPPYGLTDGANNTTKGFMGKAWDGSGIEYNVEAWRKCYEVLKPGGYLLAFGGTRTFHRIACAIEDAGFEIRDTIMWLYGSGFPKSMNIAKGVEGKMVVGSANTKDFSKLGGERVERGGWGINKMQKEQGNRSKDYDIEVENDTYLGKLEPTTDLAKKWSGWGTCLKPSYEPIIVARKPFPGSCIDNILRYGVGGINIDECRVGDEVIKGGTGPSFKDVMAKQKLISGVNKLSFGQVSNAERIPVDDHIGRFPANTIFTYDETDFNEVCGGLPITNGNANVRHNNNNGKGYTCFGNYGDVESHGYDDNGSAARYFYCAKASKKDREEGLGAFSTQTVNDGRNKPIDNAFQRGETPRKNTHPTVKPCALMQYLVRLVTPDGGVVLDPFNGSGSTGKAVMYENLERNKGYKYIGIELTEEYLPISKARIEYVNTIVPEENEQMSLF